MRTGRLEAGVKTHNAVPPALRVACRTMRYNKVIVRYGFIEDDLDKGYGY
jgi:hypothetical protein